MKSKFFILFFLFLLLFDSSFICFAQDSTGKYSPNVIPYVYKITFSASTDFVVPEIPYFYDRTSVISLDDFARGLFDQSGTQSVVDNKFYIYDFYFSEKILTMHLTNGESFTETNLLGNMKGVAWFNSDTGHTFSIPHRSSTSPIVRGFSTWSDFSESKLRATYNVQRFVHAHHLNAQVSLSWKYVVKIGVNSYAQLGDVIDAIEDLNNDTVVSIDKVTDSVDSLREQQESFRQEDTDSATGVQDTATSFVSDSASTVRDKWKILFYPIEFTNSLLSAFTGSSAYSRSYNSISGFTYNDYDGSLVPVINLSRSSPINGTVISFPSYTLPVLDIKLWDSYSYDLSTVKDSFPVLFNALYVVIGCLELYWLVSFLLDKYNSIFGG